MSTGPQVARPKLDGVEIGTAIVSYIEPHPGQAVAFNRWYERDHFPATVKAGPGVFAGARFVATRSCKELRPRTGRLFGDPARGSYLAVAWVLPGKQEEWDEWVGREMETIAAQGRLFPGRDHVHTAVYRWIWQSGAVDGIFALDGGFAGAIVVADEHAAPRLDLPGADLPVAVGLRLERTIVSQAGPPAHELVLGLCAGDPRAAFTALSPPVDGCGFASPFLAAIPGTDEYADDL
ncbi:MAG: hypothetical protein M3Q30_23090 [Actinomycetota bacterium]|nr:hypothetical protein [Actinomycetota bacterium]